MASGWFKSQQRSTVSQAVWPNGGVGRGRSDLVLPQAAIQV